MRGTVSKRLRRQVYGREFVHSDRKYRVSPSGRSIINTGRRAQYLKLKRAYSEGMVV